jgi:glycine cleavage system aminomethyltransferase T
VSVLDFLSPSLAADDDGLHPVARSSMERRYRDAGATFEKRGGWLVPISVPGEAEHLEHVGVADLSHLTKLDVRPSGEPATGRAVTWYPLSPRRALCMCHQPELDAVRGQLADRSVVDVTAAYGVLVLVGPEAPTALRRLTHLHRFPSGGEVAHITAHVLPLPGVGPDAPGPYMVVFPQEYGHYLYEVAVDRAGALGGGPIGVDALGATA